MLKNGRVLFPFSKNSYKYLLILLFLLFSPQNSQTILYGNPNISLIIFGNEPIKVANPNSYIKPKKIYLTETKTELTPQSQYSISINNGKSENNITLEFSEDDINLSKLFEKLRQIRKVDLTHFTNEIIDTSYMFSECNDLEGVIMGDIDTSEVTNMGGMFQFTNLTSFNLSGINTHKVKSINNMFNSCNNLQYLILTKFKYNSLQSANKMLDGCQDSLIFLDISSYRGGNVFDLEFLENINKKLIFCVNKGAARDLFDKLKTKGHIFNCSYLTPQEIQNEEKQTMGIIPTTKVIPTPNVISKFNCSSKDLFVSKCEDINTNKTLSVNDKDSIINNLMNDIINGSLNPFLDEIVEGNKDDLIVTKDDISFQITTTDNQNNNEYNNISTIYLGNCETILKNIYKIPFNLSLIILKVDYSFEDLKFPVIGYEVFHPTNKTKLNLGFCDNETVSYNIPVEIKEKDLDKYNSSSDYYNDECSVYTTDDGTDIIINDRKKEFNENKLSLCENGCNYVDYNTSSKKSVCVCEVKSKINSISEIIENKESLSQNFNLNDSETSSSNLGLMKCIDTLFSKYGLLKNLENYILIIMTFIFAGSSILYYRLGSELLGSDIAEILDNKMEEEKKNKSKTTKKGKKNKSLRKYKQNELSNPEKKKKRKNSLHYKEFDKKRNTVAKNNINIHIDNNKSISVSKIKINNSNTNNFNIPKENDAPTEKLNFNDYELNTLPYKEALLYDKREVFEIYCSIIRRNHPLLFSFVPNGDYNCMIIKLDMFILKFGICSGINALFFTQATIHKIYTDKGSYKLGFYFPKILLSFIITHAINIVIKYIFLSERNILNVKKKQTYKLANREADKARRCLIIKYISFYIIGTAFLFIFWFYLSSFCAVYQNTQIFLIINTFISLGISFIYPCFINIFPSILRKISLNNSHSECMYKTSKIIQII